MDAESKQQYHPVVALTDEVLRLNSRLRTLFAGVTESSGLSSMQFAVLTAVAESRTPPTVPQIGRSLGNPRQVIQRAANVLVEEGLIEMGDNPNHKRAPLLKVTAAGRKLKTAADLQANKCADELLKSLNPDDCESLTKALHQLRGKIETHIKSRSRAHGTKT